MYTRYLSRLGPAFTICNRRLDRGMVKSLLVAVASLAALTMDGSIIEFRMRWRVVWSNLVAPPNSNSRPGLCG